MKNDIGLFELDQPKSLVAMGEALLWLEQRDPRRAELMHLRIYAGLSPEEPRR